MRDQSKIKVEMEERNNRILEVAYKEFVDKGIEIVKLDDIAKKANVGVATLFRYYSSKIDLATAVCAKRWRAYIEKMEKDRPLDIISQYEACERIEYMLDYYIYLYKSDRDLLKLTDDYSHVLFKTKTEGENKEGFNVISDAFSERFHLMYNKAKEDHTVRTDIGERELLGITLHVMQATCFLHAGGVLWGMDSKRTDYIPSLLLLKEEILSYVCLKRHNK